MLNIQYSKKTVVGSRLAIKHPKGQAMLVVIVMVFTAAIAISLAVAMTGLSQTNIGQNIRLSNQAENLAESCMENTLMRLTRDVNTVPPVLLIGAGTCTISITGSSPTYQILAVGEIPTPLGAGKKISQKIQTNVSIINGVTTVTGWQRIY